MAEAGPSSPSRTVSSAAASSLSASQSRRPHIRFPVDDSHLNSGDHGFYNVTSIGQGRPSVLRRSSAAGQARALPVIDRDRDDGRRRERAVRSRRVSSVNRRSSKTDQGVSGAIVSESPTEASLAFSDEYDLSREGTYSYDIEPE
ncbi:hypothetical protein AcV5_004883 [Taiwanofungus camphoratus]|nr:hypothetical protein AcW2_000525 [Antrodia cinnamomea]KAI0936849.1 hypothetical protein AcV5_004883 [Antrodia cinnamomea]